jgi:hypothetical protein
VPDWSLTLSGNGPASIEGQFESFAKSLVDAGHSITGGAISSTEQVAAAAPEQPTAEEVS